MQNKLLENGSKYEKYDTNNDGVVSDEEMKEAHKLLQLEQERIRFENEDKKEDAQRNMAWFALSGMLLYPVCVIVAELIHLTKASEILGDMAATYFVSVAAIVAAFYAKEGYVKGKLSSDE